ncbi:MAG: TenA family protein [Pseudomonadota bacterium]|nr:TenA family protein [Pseudomonadota bacterium]
MKTLFERLRDENLTIWNQYVEHDFLMQLSSGTLAEKDFRTYLGQDYLFLIQLARAYSLAAYKSETLEEIRQSIESVSAIIDVEIKLHIEFCANWGLSETDMKNLAESEETLAYSRFVLETGLAGDLLDLHVALAPCIIGYAEIGCNLKKTSPSNPYSAWIEMYAGSDYQEVAKLQVQRLDALFEYRAGEGRFQSLSNKFAKSTQLEAAFWQQAL